MHYYILPYFICGPSLAAHRQCTFVLHRDWTRSENQERYQRKVATPSFEAHCTTYSMVFRVKNYCMCFSAAAVWRFFFVKLNFFHRLWRKKFVFESKWEQLVDFWKKNSVKSKCWKRWVIQNRPFETWLPSKMTEHNLYSKVNLTILFSISFWKLLILKLVLINILLWSLFFWPLLIFLVEYVVVKDSIFLYPYILMTCSCSKVNLTILPHFV